MTIVGKFLKNFFSDLYIHDIQLSRSHKESFKYKYNANDIGLYSPYKMVVLIQLAIVYTKRYQLYLHFA